MIIDGPEELAFQVFDRDGEYLIAIDKIEYAPRYQLIGSDIYVMNGNKLEAKIIELYPEVIDGIRVGKGFVLEIDTSNIPYRESGIAI